MIDDLNIWIANIRMDIQTMLTVTWLSRLKSGNVPQCNRAWLQRTRLTRTSQAQLRKGEKYLRFLKLWLEFTQTFLSNIKHSVSVSGAIIENYPSNIPALQLHNYCSSQWFTGLSQHFLFHLVEAGWGQQIYYKTRGGQYPALAQSLDCDWRRLCWWWWWGGQLYSQASSQSTVFKPLYTSSLWRHCGTLLPSLWSIHPLLYTIHCLPMLLLLLNTYIQKSFQKENENHPVRHRNWSYASKFVIFVYDKHGNVDVWVAKCSRQMAMTSVPVVALS